MRRTGIFLFVSEDLAAFCSSLHAFLLLDLMFFISFSSWPPLASQTHHFLIFPHLWDDCRLSDSIFLTFSRSTSSYLRLSERTFSESVLEKIKKRRGKKKVLERKKMEMLRQTRPIFHTRVQKVCERVCVCAPYHHELCCRPALAASN